MAMTSGALCSDHVNYLILRYLQEAGHESAATAFYREWHRTPEYHDPENYPFAPVVRRGELVHVIQDGLHHDKLITRVQKKKEGERRFLFTNVQSREGALERLARLENGVGGGTGSRPGSSSAKRKGRVAPPPPQSMRAPDEFPTPAPKRQRRSEGSEGVHLNGDAMEVDAASASADEDAEGEVVSPAVASEPEVIEIPERYDSMDAAVQTDVKAGPKTSTVYWKVEQPGAAIYHSMWNPSSEPESARTMLVVGDSLCRFYQITDIAEGVQQVAGTNDLPLPADSSVTASTWHPDGHTAAIATDTIRELADGRRYSMSKVVTSRRDNGLTAEYLFPALREPPGIVLSLRYSPGSEHLLVLRTNLKRGLITVYDTSSESHNREPIAWLLCPHQIIEATWTSPETLCICGSHGLFEAYSLDNDNFLPKANGSSADAIPCHGLKPLPVCPQQPSFIHWDKMCYSAPTKTLALASTANHELRIFVDLDNGSSTFHEAIAELEGQLTAFAFQPSHSHAGVDESVVLLATAFVDGSCILYRYSTADYLQGIATEAKLFLEDGPALAIAWSPDGQFLAVSGTDLLQIWDMNAVVTSRNERDSEKPLDHRALVTWRPDPAATGPRNGELHSEDGRLVCEPSLSWSSDGERLGFAVDRQVAIVSFRPPLERVKSDVGNHVGRMNGHASP